MPLSGKGGEFPLSFKMGYFPYVSKKDFKQRLQVYEIG